jgi:hypothetical protein
MDDRVRRGLRLAPLAFLGAAGWLLTIADRQSILGTIRTRIQILLVWPSQNVRRAAYLRERHLLEPMTKLAKLKRGAYTNDGADAWEEI